MRSWFRRLAYIVFMLSYTNHALQRLHNVNLNFIKHWKRQHINSRENNHKHDKCENALQNLRSRNDTMFRKYYDSNDSVGNYFIRNIDMVGFLFCFLCHATLA